MSRWKPITSAAQLAELCHDPDHDADCQEGYRDGRAGEPPPGPTRSPSYRHGWHNGDCDRSGARSPEAVALIKSCRGAWGGDVNKWGGPLPAAEGAASDA